MSAQWSKVAVQTLSHLVGSLRSSDSRLLALDDRDWMLQSALSPTTSLATETKSLHRLNVIVNQATCRTT